MIPTELKILNQWVNINSNSKLPLSPFDGYPAASSNPVTWGTFEQAEAVVKEELADNLGFVFSQSDEYIGVDLDSGVFEDGKLTQYATNFIDRFNSYTEVSRSGRGIHIIVKGKLPFKGSNNHDGVEIYSEGRYFITTGNVIEHQNIIENQDAIDWVVNTFFSQCKNNSDAPYAGFKIYTPVWDKSISKRCIPLRPTYPIITPGSRNISLTSLAGSLHTMGYTKPHIFSELLVANAQACYPPLSQQEIQTIVNSVTRYIRH